MKYLPWLLLLFAVLVSACEEQEQVVESNPRELEAKPHIVEVNTGIALREFIDVEHGVRCYSITPFNNGAGLSCVSVVRTDGGAR